MEIEQFPESVRERLEDMETQYGAMAGKIALAMDLITDAEISAGQLSVYCRNGLNPAKPHPDLEDLQTRIKAVRTLLKGAFRERKNQD